MNRLEIAQYIALGATALMALGFCLYQFTGVEFEAGLIGFAFVMGLISYVFGGFGTAIKMAFGIAKWGWVVTSFPVSLMTFFMSFLFAILVFVCVPIIPVRKAYKESGLY